MRILSRPRLRAFAAKHSDAEQPLAIWWRLMKAKRYTSSHELKRDFPAVSFLGSHRTVFNIRAYRLVVDMRYDLGRVFIRHVLTHEEYDRRTKAGTL